MPLCSRARAEERSRLTLRRLGSAGLELGVCLRWHSALQGEQLPSRSLRRCLETALAWSRDLAVARSCEGLARAGCGCSLRVCRHQSGPGEAPHEGSERSKRGCAEPGSFVNTEQLSPGL
ncbi:hypothetical protein DV515_00013378 [Chloebia gouldiae]|uniref:Uncharacterized protein n=1 Tax=Chloebia gouldiae TaxID=44316 RepID=A0A3L8S254_CHLGU|nr:hypothetical protein DV515_00013378 [Chloebia gouldiae]